MQSHEFTAGTDQVIDRYESDSKNLTFTVEQCRYSVHVLPI